MKGIDPAQTEDARRVSKCNVAETTDAGFAETPVIGNLFRGC